MTTREAKYVKAKIQGKSNTQAAMEATGAKTKDVAKTQGHRLSTNVNVQNALAQALKRHDITIDRVLAPISKGLDAKIVHREYVTTSVKEGKKTTEKKTEVVVSTEDNIPLQLSASDRAAKLMGLDKPTDKPDAPVKMDTEALMEAIKNGDMVTLQQIIFNSQQ